MLMAGTGAGSASEYDVDDLGRMKMVRIIAAALVAMGAGAASADVLELRDEAGAAMKVDTAKIAGCKMVFDSDGAAFELCRLEKVELRPPQSTRARPGAATNEAARASVVYTKATE